MGCASRISSYIFLENVAKSRDKPTVDVVIADSGEVCLPLPCHFCSNIVSLQLEVEAVTDEEGNQVPLHAEL